MSPVDMDAGKPYPAYKASGVEWLGDVPAHWEVRRLGQIGIFSKGSGSSKEDESHLGVPCIRYGDLYTTHQYFIEKSRSFVPPERAANYTPIKFGDILFAASGETIEEIGKSAINLIISDACCGGDVILFRAHRKMVARFLGYAADCRSAAAYKASIGRGFTIIHIYATQLKRLSLALPPLPEQAAIARFLDYMHRRITRCIKAKEKLIALLEEYRQVVISDAVTGRFDVRTGKPYPAYKASGVEWLGDVPAHWQIERLKSLMQNVVDLMPACNEAGTVIALENVEGWTGGIRCIDSAASLDSQLKRFRAGDVLFGKLRPYLAKVTRPTTNGCCVGEFLVLRPRHRNVVESYVERILRSKPIIDAVNSSTFGAKMPRADWQFIGRMPITLPPLPEQAAIARFLDRKTEKIAESIFQAQNRIDLLHEYRIRLISDVVTGKLDVREAGAELPETESIDGFGESEVV